MEYYARYDSPVGELLLTSDGENLTGLWMNTTAPQEDVLPLFDRVKQWLDDYFRGENPPVEDLPLAPEGTAFQHQVWKILLRIPSGETRAYGDIAREVARILGKEKMSAQAVGGAVGRNPISIWSMSNSEHPMSSQQEYVRQRILEDEAIPSEYDLFIFNASAETAINIRSEIDFVVVNNSDATHIKQARGRVRHDIDTLFVPQRLNVSIRLDEKYLNHPLTPQEKRAMRLSTGLKDSHGKPLPYGQLKERLINMGYSWAEDEEGRLILSAPV